MSNRALEFFERHYRALRRPHQPMSWMKRLFLRVVDGRAPKLVDLPTGAGKTDLIVVWLIALAWYGEHRASRRPIPRRLVWVVNRRVLVQQVFTLSETLVARLVTPENSDDADAEELKALLGRVCRPGTAQPFNVVQLRGQLVDDREWTFDPTIPQLIIGTVDQIGSRLLFQGYGLGKWSRPLHAALLGVDAWICIDEAHLVPEFALTLRQISKLACTPIQDDEAAPVLSSTIGALPLWTTELSATPALERPSAEDVLTLTSEDEDDTSIRDRLCALRTREVRIERVADKQSLAKSLEASALALVGNIGTVAIFCRKARDASAIARGLRKDPRVGAERVLLITGRLRGYERDRIQGTSAFKAFKRESPESAADSGTYYLVGTAAAEVGLDADADRILCDFAPIPTLLQRLGRLDRRGALSRVSIENCTEPPRMVIHAYEVNNKAITHLVETLSCALNAPADPADTYTATAWRQLFESGKPDNNEGKGVTVSCDDAIIEASLRILLSSEAATEDKTAPSSTWAADPYAKVTVGPIVAPPLCGAVIQQWAATTAPPNPFLPVHPWLYGLLPDERGTLLVGIAFRLELDLLRFCDANPEDDAEDSSQRLGRKILNIFRRFPPLRSELHFIPLSDLQDALRAEPGAMQNIVRFDGDEWTWYSPKDRLSADDVLVMGTSSIGTSLGNLLDTGEVVVNPVSDVFDAVSDGAAKYCRHISESPSDSDWAIKRLADGVLHVVQNPEAPDSSMASLPQSIDIAPTRWKLATAFTLQGTIGARPVTLRYFVPERSQSNAQSLNNHLATAQLAGKALAGTIAPENAFLNTLLSEAGATHDLGKRYETWQRAMGNSDFSNPIAKPSIERPASTHGYRHEWGSVLAIAERSPDPTRRVESCQVLWQDLLLHLVGSHHGYLRPALPDRAFPRPPAPSKQAWLRKEAVERYGRLQAQLNPWRLAYLESLVKTIDVVASRDASVAVDAGEDSDEQ